MAPRSGDAALQAPEHADHLGQDTYVREGLGDKWEEQARFGYSNGIALALHLPEGRHFSSASIVTSRCRSMPAN